MPQQRLIGQAIRSFLQNRVKCDRFLLILVVEIRIITRARSKEGRRGKLFAVTCNNDLFRAEDRTDRILREDLGCLVKDHHVKFVSLCLQEVGNGQR